MGLISNGTTIFDNGVVNAGGSMTFISKATASASASIEFTSGIDSTYKEYIFYFVNIHPQNNGTFDFNLSTDNGSNYNVTKTSTAFRSIHSESDITSFGYRTAVDLAQSTSFQQLHNNVGNDSDKTVIGEMHLFNPSSTTFVKHFLARIQSYSADDYSQDYFIAGYGNTTSPINAIKFQMNSGNIDAGEILLFGVN